MGAFLAATAGQFDWAIAVLSLLTATLLQTLSNLANDYGDSIHGADRVKRAGPPRAVGSGQISAATMRRAIALTVVLTMIMGLGLLWLAFGVDGLLGLVAFLALGLLAIWAAITYTAGGRPYGYVGLGDLAVLAFFGWLGVAGSYFLYTKILEPAIIFPSTSIGLFAVAVLNVNNVRDIDSDRLAGKRSIPARLGRRRAGYYHWGLLLGGLTAATFYAVLTYRSPWQFLFLTTLPLFLKNGWAVTTLPAEQLDPYLKQMSLTTLLFVLTFGLGQLIGI